MPFDQSLTMGGALAGLPLLSLSVRYLWRGDSLVGVSSI